MGGLVASNALLLASVQWLYGILNTGHWFRLYQNSFVPTPANVLADFSEANFSGYTPFNLSGQFSAPILQQNGEYLFSTQTSLFVCTKGFQTVYGGYISDGYNVKLSQAFPIPISVSQGSQFQIPIVISDWALSIVP